MKINDRYEIRVVVIETINDGTADVYDNFEDFKKEHPFSSYRFGFVVFDTEYGYVPDNCNDWNDSPDEAMMDFEENCQQKHNSKGEIDTKERVVELINQIGNSLDSPDYAERVLTECGKEILQIISNLEEQIEVLNQKCVEELTDEEIDYCIP